MKRVWVNTKGGFTIVELLIVIVVIGILAAIVIVAYNGIQNRAHDSSVQTDLNNLAKKYELFKIDKADGTYPDTAAELSQLNVSVNKNTYDTSSNAPYNLTTCFANDATDFSIAAISKSGKKYFVTNTEKAQEYTGSSNWSGASSYVPMCTSTLSGGTFISGGAGYGAGDWRPWIK